MSEISKALMTAVKQYRFQNVEFLLDEGADVNYKDNKGHTPLHLTVICGTIDCCLSLIIAGADVNIAANNGETPLIKAALLGKVPQVEYLLDNGADVNVVDSNGRNALFYAAEQGNIGILTLLLKARADVKAVDSREKQCSLLIVACKGHDKYVGNLSHPATYSYQMVRNVDDQNALQAASRSNHESCLNLLLEAGADVNIIDHGHQALTTAASYGHSKCVNLLLEAGADVNFCPEFGETALCSTAGRGDVASARRLIQKGADVNQLHLKNGHSALSAAAYKKSIECVKLLLQAGAHLGITRVDRHPFYSVNCINRLWSIKVNCEIIILLQVAGEKINKGFLHEMNEGLLHGHGHSPIHESDANRYIKKACEYLFDEDPTLCLMNICRHAIREHLLQMSRVNLFIQIPHLGLPPSLSKYLLYGVDLSLDSSPAPVKSTVPTRFSDLFYSLPVAFYLQSETGETCTNVISIGTI